MALFALASHARERGVFDFEVIHIDHGWRSVSSHQAQELKKWVTAQGVPFHLLTTTPQGDKDQENRARQQRLAFFKDCVEKHNLEGVLVAHHRDDQAETVLKRVLEGAGLAAMQGLRAIRDVEGVKLIRPLLELPKKALYEFVSELALPIIEDETASDERYLRNRMRHTLIPKVEADFGKGITKNLSHLGEVAREVNTHLESVLPLMIEEIEGPLGSSVTFKANVSLALKRFFLRKWALEEGQHLSYEAISQLLYAPATGDKYVFTDKWGLTHQGDAFYFLHKSFILNPKLVLAQYEVKKGELKQDWCTFFQGSLSCPISYDEVVSMGDLPPKLQSKLNKRYSESKVPCCLRKLAPIFLFKGEVAFEPLTGQMHPVAP